MMKKNVYFCYDREVKNGFLLVLQSPRLAEVLKKYASLLFS